MTRNNTLVTNDRSGKSDKSEKVETINPDKVVKSVMSKLGRPKYFRSATALNVYNNCWRVNVWCEHDGQRKITNSYFVSATENGEILNSIPEIVKAV